MFKAQQRASSSLEDVFLQRYELLRGWALRVIGNNRSQSEDLLHDLFIHFTLHQPDLDEIQNLDGFLHTTVRNLFLSQSRPAARAAHGHLSLIDYDSAEISLQSVDPREQLKVRDELQAICRYACVLIVYPRSGHSIAEPKPLEDSYQRQLDWFDCWLLNKPRIPMR